MLRDAPSCWLCCWCFGLKLGLLEDVFYCLVGLRRRVLVALFVVLTLQANRIFDKNSLVKLHFNYVHC